MQLAGAPTPLLRCRDLEIQLKTEQVHVTAMSEKLAAHRIKGTYGNYGERLYVEGRIEAIKKEQEVGWPSNQSCWLLLVAAAAVQLPPRPPARYGMALIVM